MPDKENGRTNGSSNVSNGVSPAIKIPKPGAVQDVPQRLTKDPYLTIPPISTYAGRYNEVNKSYYIYFDEALRNSQANTLSMRRDGYIEELLNHRRLPIISLPFHMESDDPEHPDQTTISEMVQKIVSNIPRLKNIMVSLMEAIFYGRYGVQIQLGPRKVAGNEWTSVVRSAPINGDKFRYLWNGTPGIAIYSGDRDPKSDDDTQTKFLEQNKKHIKNTMLGSALFLETQALRDRFLIHNFQGSDTDYLFEIDEAQSIFGVGLRSRLYWTWNLRTEIWSWIVDSLQRIGASGLIYGFYPTGNAAAQRESLNSLSQLVKDNIGVFPVPAGFEGKLSEWLQRIEPSPVGYEVMERLVDKLDGIMRRTFLGQDLSSESKPTGIGGGAADLHADVRTDIIQYDAEMLAETFTEQLVSVILRYNTWKYEGESLRGDDLPFSLKWVFDIDKGDGPARLEAASACFAMGVELDKNDVRKAAGFSPPKKKADILTNPELEMQKQQNQAGVPQYDQAAEHLKGIVGQGKEAQKMGMMGGKPGMSNGKPSRFAKPKETFSLAGRLYLSQSGWGLMKVPNNLVRGIFDALHESGAILPPQDSDLPKSKWKLNAHVSVLRPEEIEKIGGSSIVTDWGHHFHYQLGPIKKVDPEGWDAMKEVYFIDIDSPELEDMREKYGLSRLPNKNKFRFHVTVAVKLAEAKGSGLARFSKTGDDCGHDPDGDFSLDNTCADESGIKKTKDELLYHNNREMLRVESEISSDCQKLTDELSEELSHRFINKLERYQDGVISGSKSGMDELYEGYYNKMDDTNYQNIIRDKYDPVREKLREEFGDLVPVYRSEDRKQETKDKPLSAYTLNSKVARSFHYDEKRRYTMALIPVDSIWMAAKTKDRPLEFLVENHKLKEEPIELTYKKDRGRKHVKRFSKKDFHEGGESISASDKTLTSHKVGEILTKQYYNKKSGYTPEQMEDKWLTSSSYKLMKDVPIWILRPYKYEAPDDLSHSKGPLIVDSDKRSYKERWGAFGSNPEFLICDGKHRWWMALRAGKKTYDCFVGNAIYEDMKEYIKEFSAKRAKFIMKVNTYYREPVFENKEEVIESGLDCDLTQKQIDMFFSNFKKGIKFDFDYGCFEGEGHPEPDRPKTKSKFAKADDCGHDPDGDFSKDNTCAAGGSGSDEQEEVKKKYKYVLNGPSRSEEEYKSTCNNIFGREVDTDEMLGLISMGELSKAFPDFEPKIMSFGDHMIVGGSTEKMRVVREISKDKNGNISISNDKFFLAETGTGLGISVFTNQVENAIKSGVSKITCKAIKASGVNGYYTWARFGYDGDSKDGKKVSDYMKTEDGRNYWKEHGDGFSATFDLSEGSQSRRVLSAYLKEKGKDSSDSPDRFNSQSGVSRWPANNLKANSHQSSRQQTNRLSIEPGNRLPEKTKSEVEVATRMKKESDDCGHTPSGSFSIDNTCASTKSSQRKEKLESLRESGHKEIAEAKETYSGQKEDMINDQKSEWNDLRKEHHSSRKEFIRDAMKERASLLRDQEREKKETTRENKKEYNTSIKDLNKELKQSKKDPDADHDELDDLYKEEYDHITESSKKELEDTLDSFKRDHASAIEELKKNQIREFSSLKDDQKEERSDKKKEFKEYRSGLVKEQKEDSNILMGDLKKGIKEAGFKKKSKFAKAGDADDCGHNPSGGFSEGNTCAGGDGNGNNKKEYKYIDKFSSDDHFKAVSNKIFGREVSKEDIVGLVGGDSISKLFPDFKPEISHSYENGQSSISISFNNDNIFMERKISIDPTGKTYIKNDAIEIKNKDMRKHGIGLKVFSDQVNNAVNMGISYIKCNAAKDAGKNGYYTWPRMGYDGKLDTFGNPNIDKISKITGKSDNIMISDLMKSPEGREFWKEHGYQFNAVFRLSEGSQSRQVLEAYLKEKGK